MMCDSCSPPIVALQPFATETLHRSRKIVASCKKRDKTLFGGALTRSLCKSGCASTIHEELKLLFSSK